MSSQFAPQKVQNYLQSSAVIPPETPNAGVLASKSYGKT
jgi:hypothetical protein